MRFLPPYWFGTMPFSLTKLRGRERASGNPAFNLACHVVVSDAGVADKKPSGAFVVSWPRSNFCSLMFSAWQQQFLKMAFYQSCHEIDIAAQRTYPPVGAAGQCKEGIVLASCEQSCHRQSKPSPA